METGITKLFNENGEQIITSLDIAKLTGKEHKNVLRDIRNMEPAWEKLHQLKFEQMQIRENLPERSMLSQNWSVCTSLPSMTMCRGQGWCCVGKSWSVLTSARGC